MENAIVLPDKDDDFIAIFPCKRLRQRAMPSPPNKAELSVGRTSVGAVGALACCFCHKRKAVVSPMTSTVKWQCTTTAASLRLGKFNRCQGCFPSLKMPFSITERQS